MKKYFVLIFVALLTGTSAFALSDQEISEIMKTANTAEIDAAKVAQKKASDSTVKDFANQMVKEHEDNLKTVKKVSETENVKMKSSDESKNLKKNASDKLNEIKKKSGKDFDQAYMQMQVDMHKQLLADMESKFIPQAKDPEFKSYLETTKEAVQHHLSEAEDVLSKIK
jgi:putative membrane protein